MIIFRCIRKNSSSSKILKMTNLAEIRTFVFFDIETTGLPQMENNKTKITELCMVAVQADHIRLGVFPRVQNKLNFCFNPWKLISADSEKITGLSNNLLECQSKFSAETVNSINCFLNHNQKPICLVAHNGNYFDYPILQKEIQKSDTLLDHELVCIDSLQAFKEIYLEETRPTLSKAEEKPTLPIEFTNTYDNLLCDITDTDGGISEKVLEAKRVNETTPKKQIIKAFPAIVSPSKKLKVLSSKQRLNLDVSFKLSEVYTRLTKKSPINEHEAESDVLMLITCAATLGDKFVDWANVNAKKFCDIPPMVPGKRIGS